MNEFFLSLFNLSVSASWLVLAVVLFRFIFKKAPKWINCLLWSFVGIKLALPFSIESVFSLIPSAETLPPEIVYESQPAISSGIYAVNSIVNPIVGSALAPEPGASVNPIQVILEIAGYLWLCGLVAMVLYAVISYLRLNSKMKTATLFADNVYQSEFVESPFVLGFFRPKIYIPYAISADDIPFVVAHENAHIARKDHFIKPLSFLVLSVYWFNPVIWLAYILLCRDIELACDEKAVGSLGEGERKEYSYALLNCSVNRRVIAACPLAFGEVNVKNRIKSVMNYKKPAFWIIIAAVIASAVVAVCFLTNPAGDKLVEMESLDFPIVHNATVATPSGIFETSDLSETEYAAEFAKSVRVDKKPLSQDRSNTRVSAYKVSFTVSWPDIDNYRFFTLNFNKDCTEVWVDNFVKPSLTYKVKNPSRALDFFESHEIYCATYTAGELLYCNSMFSVVGGVEGNTFYNFDSRMHLSEKTSGVLGWVTIGEMEEYELDEYNFDYKLSRDLEHNFDPSKIRRENKKTWRIAIDNPDSDVREYLLLEQKNGELIIVKSFGADSANKWIYKLEKAYSDAPRSLDAAIDEAILVNEDAVYFDTWYGFASHYVIDKKEEIIGNNKSVTAYALTLYEIYYLEDDGTLVCQSAKAKPVMMTFNILSDGSYILQDYQEHNVKSNPDGSKKIEQLFPEAVNGDYASEAAYMKENCYEKAAAYFNIRDYAVRYEVRELMPTLSLPFGEIRNKLYMESLNSDKLSINSQMHLPIYKFDSLQELLAFRDKYASDIDFDVEWDECPSFNEYVSKFNDEYFRNNSLLLIVAEEPSCSFRHKVGGIVINSRQLQVTVNTVTVNPAAELMGCWFVPVQIGKNVTDACDSFDAVKGTDIENKVVGKYSYNDSTEPVNPYIVLYDNGRFQFMHCLFSSTVPAGGYEYVGDYLVLKSLVMGGRKEYYYFRVEGSQLIFDASKSTPLPEFGIDGADKPFRPGVPDGAVFT